MTGKGVKAAKLIFTYLTSYCLKWTLEIYFLAFSFEI